MIVDKSVPSDFKTDQDLKGVPQTSSKDDAPDDLPPPYTRRENPPMMVAGPASGPSAHQAGFHMQALPVQQEVNGFYMISKHNSLSGSYTINPDLPAPGAFVSRWKSPLDKKNRRQLTRSCYPPNAIMHTRHGSVTLNIATAGNPNVVNRAHVQTSTRAGKLHVNVHSIQLNKRIFLEASTRHGNIVVLVPPNFRGALQFRTRRGQINFSPTFQRSSRLVSAIDNNTLVCFGEGLPPYVDLNDPTLDVCLVSSRHGRIDVGISGVDHYDHGKGFDLIGALGSLSMSFLGTDITTHLR